VLLGIYGYEFINYRKGLIMIMQDYKNVKTEEKQTAWEIVGAVAFAVILISLIFIATI
jgi:hypothetical protein